MPNAFFRVQRIATGGTTPPTYATQFTLSLSASSGTNGSPITVTVTPNGPLASTVNVLLFVSGGGSLGLSGFSFPSGSSAAQSTTLTRSVDGTSIVTMTNDGGLGNAGTPINYTTPLLPTWLIGASANQVVQISGTSGFGGAAINPWGTLPLITGTATLVSPANGGHQDSADNRVTSIDLLQNAPSWTVRIAASSNPAPLTTNGVDYYPDGTPASRHGYHHAHYISQRGRMILFGGRGKWSQAGADSFKLDGHSVTGTTWAWDAAGTYPDSAGAKGFGVAHDPTTGNVWTASPGWMWEQATNSWTQPLGGGFPVSWRWPVAFDSSRYQFFTLQYGDGQGFDLGRGVVASKFHPTTGAQTAISFNASAALTQFQTDQPIYAGMDYDAINDRFLFYSGIGSQAGRVYVITPNAGSTWDMSILALSGATLPATISAGINGRFRYVPALSGFVVAPSATDNLYFFKVV